MSNQAGVGPDSNKFMFRMPDGLRNKLKVLAARNRRSMNSELLLIVERAMNEADSTTKGAA